jgi:multiple sugar transport system ATP-binding protein
VSVLEVRGLKKHYGSLKALDGIDIETRDGEFLAILGPSGCGKTTLMRLIAGLEMPNGGDVLIDNKVVTPWPPRARNIAMVFQGYALYPHMSVRNNIAFALKARGVAPAERERRIKWAVEMLGIEQLLARRPARLSGGEKQKVALARALVREPKLFIFDEPLSSLDAQIRARARGELRQLHDRTGVTTVYVTHDQVEAMGMGDRIAVMRLGKLRQLGRPETLYAHPADTFVASFIGTPPMNLIERADVTVGFRPEHALPREAAGAREDLVPIRIRVTQIEFLGSEWLAYGTVEDAIGEGRVLCKLQREAMAKVHIGALQDFVVPRAELRFFDRESGLGIPPVPV